MQGEDPPVSPGEQRERWSLVVGVLTLAVGMGLLVVNQADPVAPAAPADLPALRADNLGLPPGGAWARIRPAGAPSLCVSEGVDLLGRHATAVAVQRPCADPGPRTLLEPAGDFVAIKWEHAADKALGCLTVLDSGPAAGLVEPREHCEPGMDAQSFHLERAGTDVYRIRRSTTDRCLGAESLVAGAEIAEVPCGGDRPHEFLIEAEQTAG